MEKRVLWRKLPPQNQSPSHRFGHEAKGTSPTSSLEGVFSWGYHSELGKGCPEGGRETACFLVGLTVPPLPLLSWEWRSGWHC